LRIRAPQKFVGGLALVVLAIFVVVSLRNMSQGSIHVMGPAMFPRWLAIALGAGGVFLIVDSFFRDGEGLIPSKLRGPVMVTIGILLFAVTIRDFGLSVAGMLCLLVSSFGTDEARPVEVVIFSALMTAGCVLLFRYLLDMAVLVFAIPGTSIAF
jgi:hypothetical protein